MKCIDFTILKKYDCPKETPKTYYYKSLMKEGLAVIYIKSSDDNKFLIIKRIWDNPYGGGASNPILIHNENRMPQNGSFLIGKTDYKALKKMSLIGKRIPILQGAKYGVYNDKPCSLCDGKVIEWL